MANKKIKFFKITNDNVKLFGDNEVVSHASEFLVSNNKEICISQSLFLTAIRYICFKNKKFNDYKFDLILVDENGLEYIYNNRTKENLEYTDEDLTGILDVQQELLTKILNFRYGE